MGVGGGRFPAVETPQGDPEPFGGFYPGSEGGGPVEAVNEKGMSTVRLLICHTAVDSSSYWPSEKSSSSNSVSAAPDISGSTMHLWISASVAVSSLKPKTWSRFLPCRGGCSSLSFCRLRCPRLRNLNTIVSSRICRRISSNRALSVPARDVGLACAASSRLYSSTRSQFPPTY